MSFQRKNIKHQIPASYHKKKYRKSYGVNFLYHQRHRETHLGVSRSSRLISTKYKLDFEGNSYCVGCCWLVDKWQSNKQLDDVGKISRACGNLTQEYQRKRVDDLTAFKCILPYGKYTVKQTPMSELCVKISFEENKILSKIRKTSEKIHYASDWLPEPIQNAHPSNISKLKKFIQRKYAILRSEVPLHILVITSVTLLTVVLYYCTLWNFILIIDLNYFFKFSS